MGPRQRAVVLARPSARAVLVGFVVATLALTSAPALAGADLVMLVNQSETEARRVLASIELAPSVTGGIREFHPPSMSKLCTLKQLSTVEADVYLTDGVVTRVEDRRRSTRLGDQQAAFAFLRAIEKETGTPAQVAADGEYARFVTGPDVAMVFRIVPRGGVFTVVATGAEVVNASAKCDERKAIETERVRAEAKAQRAADAADHRQRCEAGEVKVCADAAALADDAVVAMSLGRRGCDAGDADACGALVRAAMSKGDLFHEA